MRKRILNGMFTNLQLLLQSVDFLLHVAESVTIRRTIDVFGDRMLLEQALGAVSHLLQITEGIY